MAAKEKVQQKLRKPKKVERLKSLTPRRSPMRRTTKSACYVLITCGEPTEDGRMHVEMTYEGDTVLAAYLLENAQSILDEKLQPSSSLVH